MLFSYLSNRLSKRRATSSLAEAMRRSDLPGMRQALEKGADLANVHASFEMPMQYFQELYEVRGAIPLAIEMGLPPEAFAMLLEYRAPIPYDLETRLANFGPRGPHILDMIQRIGYQHADLEASTPKASAPPRTSRL